MSDTPPNLVAHIGGTFIYSANPEPLANWYKQTLGLQWEHPEGFSAWYALLEYRELESDKKRHIVWSIINNKNRPHVEGKVFCINYRVHNMEATVEHLKAQNIEVKGPENYPEGRFAWITDPEGNTIELWEDTPQEIAAE